MVQLHDRPTEVRSREPVPSRMAEMITGMVALLSAAIGAWLYWGPADGVLQVFGWEWTVSDVHTGWGLGLMMVGAVLATIAVALGTTRTTR